MNSCEQHHYCIVVYDGKECPFCSLESDAQWNIEKRDNKINELEGEISDLKGQLEE